MASHSSTGTAPTRASGIAKNAFSLILALVGPIAALAPNGIAVVFIALGLSAVACGSGTRRLSDVPKAIVLLVVGIVLWGLVSVLWAPDAKEALDTVARIAIAGYLGLAILSRAMSMDSAELDAAERSFLIGYVAGLAVLAAEVASQFAFGYGHSLFARFRGPPAASESFLNRPKTVYSILLVLALSIAKRRHGWKPTIGIGLVCSVVFVVGESMASALGLILAALGAIAGAVLGARGAPRIAAAIAVIVVLGAPILARAPALSELAERRDITVSIYHRAAIWGFVAERVAERPLAGWGLEASRNIPNSHNRLSGIAEMLPLHPHNAPLQYWLELGAVGALLFAALAAAVALRCGGPLARRVVLFPTFTNAFFVACVSYGVWQGWWYSTLWIAAAVSTIVARKIVSTDHHIG